MIIHVPDNTSVLNVKQFADDIGCVVKRQDGELHLVKDKPVMVANVRQFPRSRFPRNDLPELDGPGAA